MEHIVSFKLLLASASYGMGMSLVSAQHLRYLTPKTEIVMNDVILRKQQVVD